MGVTFVGQIAMAHLDSRDFMWREARRYPHASLARLRFREEGDRAHLCLMRLRALMEEDDRPMLPPDPTGTVATVQ